MKSDKKTILIIDDDPLLTNGTKENLQDDGFIVIEAYDGLTGFNLAKKHQPDLIILDVSMPGLNGFKVCTMLKKEPKTKNINIILYTSALSSPEGEEQAKKLAEAYIIKSSRYTELLELISSLI